MARAGLTKAAVVEAAAALVDREGVAALTLLRVAGHFGVRSPSLYHHVDGLEALRREVALAGVAELGEMCRSAVMGRSGADGLRVVAAADREFALSHPGVYPLTQVARPGDAGYEEVAGRLLEPVLALLSGFGLAGDDLIHAARAVRSALHGFTLLEVQSGFGLDVDRNDSFDWMVALVERGLTQQGRAPASDSPAG
jgi:AcrR family transcriptional regulator